MSKKCKECQVEIQPDLIFCSICKKAKEKKSKKYARDYSKYYYLKKTLEDKDYNKKKWAKEKAKGTIKRKKK